MLIDLHDDIAGHQEIVGGYAGILRDRLDEQTGKLATETVNEASNLKNTIQLATTRQSRAISFAARHHCRWRAKASSKLQIGMNLN